jgi:peptidase C39-like protein/tetratricopeptide repeat protein
MSGSDRFRQLPIELRDGSQGRAQMSLKIVAALCVIGLIVAVNIVLFSPVRNRAEYAIRRVQSAVKKLQPHDRYVPTPVLATPTPETRAGKATGEATATQPPDPTPTAAATAVPTPTSQMTPLPVLTQIENDCHEPQGWNNCGPATLSMILRFYGWTEDQYTVATAVKPDKNDKNVSPEEMIAYSESLGDVVAVMGVATDTGVLKHLLSKGYPVIVETWFIPEPDDEMGHYRLLTGYDDTTEQFTTQDAYNGADQLVPYQELSDLWKVFNRVYVVLAKAEQAQELSALLGGAVAPETMYGRALAVAQAETAAHPEDRYAWFNMGTNYVELGQYLQAAEAYDRARMLNLPWRMLWYQFGPFEAYLQVGRYQDVIDLANANLKVANNLEESYYYRALAHRALGDEAAARQDLETALQYNPHYDRAAAALDE